MTDAFVLAGVLPLDDPALANVGNCCARDTVAPPQVAFAGELPWAGAVRDIIEDFVARSGRPDLIVWVDGWEVRGRPYSFSPEGLVCHHTADQGYSSDYPALGIVRDGRSDLPGPLSEFGIGRFDVDGWARVYVIAAGYANHAGSGGWDGLTGNGSVVGIEWASDGIGEEIGEHHRRTYRLLDSCILRRLNQGSRRLCDHKEWSDAGKIDRTGFDPDEERAAVQALLDGATTKPDPPEEDEMSLAVNITLDLAKGEQAREVGLPSPKNSGAIAFGDVHGSFSIGVSPDGVEASRELLARHGTAPFEVAEARKQIGLVVVKHRNDGTGIGVPAQDPAGIVWVPVGSGRHGHFDVAPGEESVQVALADVPANPSFAVVDLLFEIGK